MSVLSLTDIIPEQLSTDLIVDQQQLDVKGKLGWELVSVVVIPSAAAKKAQLLAFLKRPLETEQ